MKEEKKKPGRPFIDDEKRVPLGSVLVKPSTLSILTAWGGRPGVGGKGRAIDELAESAIDKENFDTQG